MNRQSIGTSRPEKITAVYCRVSTAVQKLDSQEAELVQWVERNSVDLPVLWFKEKFTGRSMIRPEMGKLLELLEQGRLSRIVVWRLDRLGRTARGLCELFESCIKHGVTLISLRDGFDLSTPSGKLHARLIASVAEYETEIRAERVRIGQAAARRKGKKIGGSKRGRKTKQTVPGAKVAAALTLLENGEPLLRVARTLGVSRTFLYYQVVPMLKNRPKKLACSENG